MWTRRELKRQARGVFKPHYWRVVLVCLIAAFITGEYGSTIWSFDVYNDRAGIEAGVLKTTIYTVQRTNADIIEDFLRLVGDQANWEPPPEPEVPAGEEDDGAKVIAANSRGVLASLFNNITRSGSIALGVLDSFSQMLFQGRVVRGFVALGAAAIGFLFWFFIKNPLMAAERRFLMEKLSYPQTGMRRALLLVRVGKLWNTAKVMFMRSFFLALWCLTIVGGVIKSYSYMLVPFIVAENPAIGWREAMGLSKTMMRGNKWKAFLLSLSFLPWQLLNFFTLGFLNVFYTNPYMTAAEAALYRALREKALADGVPGAGLLNDSRLFEAGGTDRYPEDAFPLPDRQRRKWIKSDYRRDYSIWSLILIFFTFAAAGWVWEVIQGLSAEGFVNRGVLHGPWLPIYGVGGVGVLVLLKKVRNHPVLTFFLTVLFCGVIEYGTGWFLEWATGTRWWDYSGYVLNLNGFICAEGLLVFGLGGCAAIYLLGPVLDDWYRKIPFKLKCFICCLLILLFVCDLIYSCFVPNTGEGITDYNFVVEGLLPAVLAGGPLPL
ncbi:MAG TPA: DUF975 family protein [Firmicutes bacterium]|nr:DUF975 family protein [Bacillota bacterium]